MRDYNTTIDKLEEAYLNTKSKVGSWQKDVLLIILEALLEIYFDLKQEEIKKYENL